VLTAVQETPRGRWFLDAYTARVKSEGTATILGAIAKLESHLDRLGHSGASDEVLQKARSAIATARQEIAAVEPQVAKLSTEAQLFSNLADLSRKAFNAPDASPTLGKGVERALKLVADLDRDLNLGPKSNQNTVEFAAPPKPAVQYFKQDEAIFEPATRTNNNRAEIAEQTTKGAKLTIRRTGGESATYLPEPTDEARSEPAAIASEKIEVATPEPSRIVIIRRKADEEITVPMLDTKAPREDTAA
jgi:hypothetical protein